MFLPLKLPTVKDFYTDCLVAEDMETYYRTVKIVEESTARLSYFLGNFNRTLNAMSFIDNGIMRLQFRDFEDGYFQYWFEFWSVTEGEFRHSQELSYIDSLFIVDFISYSMRKN